MHSIRCNLLHELDITITVTIVNIKPPFHYCAMYSSWPMKTVRYADSIPACGSPTDLFPNSCYAVATFSMSRLQLLVDRLLRKLRSFLLSLARHTATNRPKQMHHTIVSRLVSCYRLCPTARRGENSCAYLITICNIPASMNGFSVRDSSSGLRQSAPGGR